MGAAESPQPSIDVQKPQGVIKSAKGSEVIPFKGGIAGDREGFKLQIRPDLELSVLMERTLDPKTNQEVLSGIEGVFFGPDANGETHYIPDATFRLGLEGRTEQFVPQVVQALGTLVSVGARPQEVADFVSNVESERLREHIKEKFEV